QILVEVGLQVFGGLGFDWAATRSRRNGDGVPDGCSWPVVFLVFGGLCGGLSLLIVPKLLLPTLALRLANLIVSPLAAGGLSYLVAANLWGNRGGLPQQHFWRGFCFALAFGVIRFAYVHR
ncbi:MAG TPA: hypothetical protein VKE74_35205, partial [Gemmataceae bacterium]|nr:hypothetical protein [Gemmataceae bacterium]